VTRFSALSTTKRPLVRRPTVRAAAPLQNAHFTKNTTDQRYGVARGCLSVSSRRPWAPGMLGANSVRTRIEKGARLSTLVAASCPIYGHKITHRGILLVQRSGLRGSSMPRLVLLGSEPVFSQPFEERLRPVVGVHESHLAGASVEEIVVSRQRFQCFVREGPKSHGPLRKLALPD
jgi:hypothetical protein